MIGGMFWRVRQSFRAAWLRRRGLLLLGGASFAGGLPIIDNRGGTITAGDGLMVEIQPGSRPAVLHVGDGATLTLGEGIFLNGGCSISASAAVTIGDHAKIAPGVFISDNNWHQIDEGAPVRKAPIVIGRNVWIATNAAILPGVTIGDHCVIGAGAVVTEDIPAKSVVAGNPASVVRTIDCADDFVRR
jgi:acetyltransferase-like isoleucine patch superfamily enzyme